MHEGLLGRHDENKVGRPSIHGQAALQGGVPHDPSLAADPQALLCPGMTKMSPTSGSTSTSRECPAACSPRSGSGIASVRSSSRATNPAGSPFGETSSRPAPCCGYVGGIITNGEAAMKRRTNIVDVVNRLVAHEIAGRLDELPQPVARRDHFFKIRFHGRLLNDDEARSQTIRRLAILHEHVD